MRRGVENPSRAVIIGGSVAGLLSAAAASPFFDEVVRQAALASAPPSPRRPGSGRELKVITNSRHLSCCEASWHCISSDQLREQVVVLERDPPMPPRSEKPQADGAEYTATARSRNGSPQFLHGHIYLKRGWEVGSKLVVYIVTRCLRQSAS